MIYLGTVLMSKYILRRTVLSISIFYVQLITCFVKGSYEFRQYVWYTKKWTPHTVFGRAISNPHVIYVFPTVLPAFKLTLANVGKPGSLHCSAAKIQGTYVARLADLYMGTVLCPYALF